MTQHQDTVLPPRDFYALLDCHGADLARWPVDSVKPALALMERDAQARVAFERDVALDSALRHADAALDRRIAARHGQCAPELQARILAALDGVTPAAVVAQAALKRGASGMFGLRALFAPGSSLLMIGLIGFTMGFMQPASAQDVLLDGLVHGQDIVLAGESGMAIGEW